MARSASARVRRRGAPAGPHRVLGAAFVALLSLAASGCTRLDNLLASVPVFSFLRNAPALDPYEAPRPLPANVVPFAAPGGPPPPPLQPTDAALTAFGAAVGPNPVPLDSAVLARGQEFYMRFCFVCHGPAGRGDGPVVFRAGQDQPGTRVAFAPNLTLPTTVQRTDGYIYGIIRVGRGLMPPYGDKIPDLERWYVVHYVRQLQRAAGAAGTPGAAAGQTQ